MSDAARSHANSARLYARARATIAGGVNSNARMHEQPMPTFFARGEGAYLYDVDGNRSIDYVLGMGPNILGHAPAPVIRAVGESLALGQLFGAQHESEVTLAELVCACIPCAELVRFGLSGSEMVQAALRVARPAPSTRRSRTCRAPGSRPTPPPTSSCSPGTTSRRWKPISRRTAARRRR